MPSRAEQYYEKFERGLARHKKKPRGKRAIYLRRQRRLWFDMFSLNKSRDATRYRIWLVMKKDEWVTANTVAGRLEENKSIDITPHQAGCLMKGEAFQSKYDSNLKMSLYRRVELPEIPLLKEVNKK